MSESHDDPGMFPDRPSMDDTLVRFFQERNLPFLGGTSGKGWSFYGSVARCLYLHFKNYEAVYQGNGLETASGLAEAIEVDAYEPDAWALGSLAHTALALRYIQGVQTEGYPYLHRGTWPAPEEVIEFAAAEHPQLALDAQRIYTAYEVFCDREGDYDGVIGVEHYMAADVDGLPVTTRPDLVRREGDGVVFIDNKTAGRFDYVVRNEWRQSGQLLTGALVYKLAGEPWGPLKWMEINLIGKQQEPKFERIPLPSPSDKKLAEHARLLHYLEAQRRTSQATGFWPRTGRDVGCSGRGLCPRFDHCASQL